jgi:hypothetical protein
MLLLRDLKFHQSTKKKRSMSEDSHLKAFRAISNFVHDLESAFGARHKPLKLYNRLISHTKIFHDDAVKKHITIFHDFCVSNKSAIVSKSASSLVQKKICYSDRVFIDVDFLLRISGTDEESIWKHLLNIAAITDPQDDTKELLKKSLQDEKDSGEDSYEKEFLSNIINKIETNVKPNANPMETVTNLMQSGFVNELMKDMNSKKLNMGKLLGAVQGLVQNLNAEAGQSASGSNDADMGNMLNTITGMLGKISLDGNGGVSGGSGASPPDLSGMMSMVTTMMSSMMSGSGVSSMVPVSSPNASQPSSTRVEVVQENENEQNE